MVSRAVREFITSRDHGRCHYCRVDTVLPGDVLRAEMENCSRRLIAWLDSCVGEVDHIVPRSRDGPESFDNMVLACRWCNRHKSAKSYDAFVEELLCLGDPLIWRLVAS